MPQLTAQLTAARLRELIDYDRLTGVFRWRVSCGRSRAGTRAGCVRDDGYRVIRLDRVLYQANRIAWLHVTGSWPAGEVDHRDTDHTNDAWSNLRDVPQAVNNENLRRPRKNNALGVQGVCRYRGRFKASLSVAGKHKHVGYFDSADEAHAAYVAAKRRLHTGCTL